MSKSPPFAMVPLAAITDNRLTLRQLRVFAAICSFRESRDAFTVTRTRDEIAARCGLHPTVVSAATTELERNGWLSKDGRGGYSKATVYTITTPETVAEHATVLEGETVAESATVAERATVASDATDNGSARRYTQGVAESATRKNLRERPVNPETKTIRTAPRFDAAAYLAERGVDAQVAGDWLQLRREKKAAVTRTAIDRIAGEAARAGIDLAAALATCCERGWQGFRAEWLAERSTAAPSYKSRAQTRADTLAGLTTVKPQAQPAERDITAEAERLL